MKLKAVTFSYDDGVLQDIRFIQLLDKYGLKGTFNLNSGDRFGKDYPLIKEDKTIRRKMVERSFVKELYKNHEVAAHTVDHLNLTTLSDEDVHYQVSRNKAELEELVGKEVVGMAYPCGGVNNDERVAKIVKDCGILYARTTISTQSFAFTKENLLQFNPTEYDRRKEEVLSLAKGFVERQADSPMLFYLWGHTYEFDELDGGWEYIEEVLKILSGRKDIFYGTNREVLLGKWE